MNIAELKALIANLPDEMMVCVDGYEGGIDEAFHANATDALLNVNVEVYYGRHETLDDCERQRHPSAEVATVFLISRN